MEWKEIRPDKSFDLYEFEVRIRLNLLGNPKSRHITLFNLSGHLCPGTNLFLLIRQVHKERSLEDIDLWAYGALAPKSQNALWRRADMNPAKAKALSSKWLIFYAIRDLNWRGQ